MIEKTQTDQIDVLHLLLIIWRKRWVVIITTLLTSIIGAVYYFSISNSYSANVSIQVNTEQSTPLAFGGLTGFSGLTSDDYATQVELIKSRKLLIEVVEKLNLNTNILNKKPTPSINQFSNSSYLKSLNPYLPYINNYIYFISQFLQKTKEDSSIIDEKIRTAQTLQEMITVTHQQGSEFITVTAHSYYQILATEIVNTIADTYISYHQEERKTSNEGTASWLLKELEIVKLDIAEAEKELRIFSENEDLVDIQGVMSLKADELQELSRKKTEFEQIVDDRSNQYEAMIGVTDPVVLLNSDTIKANPIIEKTQQGVSTAREALLEVSLKYGPKHPTYIFAKKNLENAQTLLDKQLLSLISAEKVKLLSEQKQLEKIESLFNDAKIEFQRLSKIEGSFLQKKREVIAHQELYEAILKKLQETQTISGLEQELATVFDYALLEDAKNTSKQKIGLIISIVSGLLIGALLALFWGLLDQKIWNVNELKRFINKPVLGNLPKVKRRFFHFKSGPYYRFNEDIVYLESIHALRSRILTSDKENQIIAVMSAMPEEGKSTISLNLSQVFSDLERVLVIDADLRRPSISKMLRLPPNHPGLSDVISRTAKLSDCIIRSEKQSFDVLTAGNSFQHSNSLISSSYMPKLLERLGQYYDRIIIETAPIYLFSDAEVMSRIVDGVLFVVKAEDTLIKDIKQGIDKLDNAGANILGTVLNQSHHSLKKQDYTRYTSTINKKSQAKNLIPPTIQ